MKSYFRRIYYFALVHKIEIGLVLILLTISGLAHSWNMFHFPYYEDDEGTYLSQGWSLVTEGKLAPYTYWYDHAPAGWFLLGAWIKAIGGVFQFGFSINSGRVLMLILHILSSLNLYLIARKLTSSKAASALSVLLFSLTPLGIIYQRRVLLDNIMVFWLLLSLVLLFYSRQRLKLVIASAFTFGVAVLSKESAVFFIPIFLYLVYTYTTKAQRRMALAVWVGIAGSVISLYFIYSFLKSEFYATGTLLGGAKEHVSLLATLKFQATRGNVSIFSAQSSFWSVLSTWFRGDPLIIILGLVSIIINLVIGIKKRPALIIGLLAFSYIAFLLRGGLILEFYVVPLIPLVALSIAYTTDVAYKFLKSKIKVTILRPLIFAPYVGCLAILIVMATTYSAHWQKGENNIYKSDQTSAQVAAVDWVLHQNTPDQFYAIDNYAYLDLNLKNSGNFKNAEYYWKVDNDKDIKNKILHDNYQNIDYELVTHQLRKDVDEADLKLNKLALANANLIKTFPGEGWYVEVWATRSPRRILSSTWESYKKNFMVGGRVLDPQNHNITTSEGQSYALLRAVWLNDRSSFEETLKWTNDNLKVSDGLYGYKYDPTKTGAAVLDKANATDADQDIALALLEAGKRWHDDRLLQEGRTLVEAIWTNEVAIVKGRPFISAGDWANHPDSVTINPSYLSPAAYRVYAEVDKKHEWLAVVDTSYEVLTACTVQPLDKTVGKLPPEWCSLNKASGLYDKSLAPQPTETEYGYNAFRTPWRVALDYQWYKDPRASQYLQKLKLLSEDWAARGKLAATYSHAGQPLEDYDNVAAYGANLGYFSIDQPTLAKSVYERKILSKLYEDSNQAYWDDPKNYYSQNWAWFGTALYSHRLPNYWDNSGGLSRRQ